MTISPYFRNLRSAYRAELDDLAFDSEGLNILEQRLTQRRKEMEFLVHMMEISPEMVAVVFHKGFTFSSPTAMDQLLTHEPDTFPDWDSLAACMDMAPWTQALVQVVHKQPMGEWFLTVAAALEYMHNHPTEQEAHASEDEADIDEDADEANARMREEAAAEWMVQQGFDRKE